MGARHAFAARQQWPLVMWMQSAAARSGRSLEICRRLVRRPDLHLSPICHPVVAFGARCWSLGSNLVLGVSQQDTQRQVVYNHGRQISRLTRRLVDVLPRIFPSEHVVRLLPRQMRSHGDLSSAWNLPRCEPCPRTGWSGLMSHLYGHVGQILR